MSIRFPRHILVVATAAQAAAINQRFQEVDARGEAPLTSALSATGLLPATHYCCQGVFTERRYQALQTRFQAMPAAQRPSIFNMNATTSEAAFASMGLKPVTQR